MAICLNFLISNHFHSQKCASLADKSYNHSTDRAIPGTFLLSFPVFYYMIFLGQAWSHGQEIVLSQQHFRHSTTDTMSSILFQESYTKIYKFIWDF